MYYFVYNKYGHAEVIPNVYDYRNYGYFHYFSDEMKKYINSKNISDLRDIIENQRPFIKFLKETRTHINDYNFHSSIYGFILVVDSDREATKLRLMNPEKFGEGIKLVGLYNDEDFDVNLLIEHLEGMNNINNYIKKLVKSEADFMNINGILRNIEIELSWVPYYRYGYRIQVDFDNNFKNNIKYQENKITMARKNYQSQVNAIKLEIENILNENNLVLKWVLTN